MAASDNGDMDSTEENPINQKATKKKRKTVVAPRKKSKKVKSSKQTLSEIASGLKTLSDSSCPPDSTRR